MNRRLVKIVAVILVLVCAGIALAQYAGRNLDGTLVNPGDLATHRQATWTREAVFSGAGSALAADGRMLADVQANTAARLYRIPGTDNRQVFRCLSTTDGDSTVFLVYGSVGSAGPFGLLGQITFTTGTCESGLSTYEMADTCSVASESGSFRSWRAISPTGNEIGYAECDTGPVYWIAIVATTVTHSAYLEHLGY